MEAAGTARAGIDRATLARAERYLASRQCCNGGFSFYRCDILEEPCLSDTWCALAAYARLGKPVPRPEAVATWLDCFDPASLHPDSLYHLAFARRWLAADWPPDARTRARIAALPLGPPANPGAFAGWLSSTLRKVRLKAAFVHLDAEPALVATVCNQQQGGYGIKPNIQDTAAALELLAALGESGQREASARFVAALQSPELGFRNTLDSHYTHLSILWAGVCCCLHLDLPVRYPAAILDLVRSAQTRDGAFADAAGALPTLESHYMALALIAVLAPTGTLIPPQSRDAEARAWIV